MERSANQPVQNDRTRYLNIVYFVESARSHTIRINLRYARWAIGAAAIIFAWAAGSVFWIVSLRWQVDETRERLESSLTTIFDYQIKNDKVFELAYPAEATKSYYSEAAQLASNNPVMDSKSSGSSTDEISPTKASQPPVTADSKPPVAQKVSTTAPEIKPTAKAEENKPQPMAAANQVASPAPAVTVVSQSAATSIQPAATASVVAPSPGNLAQDNAALIDVSGAKITKSGNKLELVFDINNRKPERALGYIWAVAAFAGADGKTIYSAAPNHVQFDAGAGKIKSFKTAYRFAIQRYKKKDFEFKAPAIKDWKLTKMTIHFTDINNSKEEVVNVPVDHFASSQSAEKPASETNL